MTLADAVVAMVDQTLPPQTPLYDGRIPKNPPRQYAVVFVDPGTLQALAVAAVSDSAIVRWQVSSYGPDRETAHAVAATVRDGIVDKTPQADGWDCGQVEHTFAQLPGHEETVPEQAVVQQIDQYRLLATRIPTT